MDARAPSIETVGSASSINDPFAKGARAIGTLASFLGMLVRGVIGAALLMAFDWGEVMARRLWVGCLAFLVAGASLAGEPLQVMLLGKERDHPYGTHMYLFECELLAKCLRQMKDVEVKVVDGWPDDAKELEEVDVLVTYSADAGSSLLAGPHSREFRSLMDRGVGLVALHWSTGCANNEVGPKWRETLGGWFSLEFSRLAVTASTVRQADAQHPISRGWKDFELRDEFYLSLRFDDRAKPIALTTIDGTEYPIAWVFDRPRGGRSFGFVCGHFHDVFLNPAYRKIAVNAVQWVAGREVPATGMPVEITTADGTLPADDSKSK